MTPFIKLRSITLQFSFAAHTGRNLKVIAKAVAKMIAANKTAGNSYVSDRIIAL